MCSNCRTESNQHHSFEVQLTQLELTYSSIRLASRKTYNNYKWFHICTHSLCTIMENSPNSKWQPRIAFVWKILLRKPMWNCTFLQMKSNGTEGDDKTNHSSEKIDLFGVGWNWLDLWQQLENHRHRNGAAKELNHPPHHPPPIWSDERKADAYWGQDYWNKLTRKRVSSWGKPKKGDL